MSTQPQAPQAPLASIPSEREQIINFLLARCDDKQRIIEDQQRTILGLQKQVQELAAKAGTAPDASASTDAASKPNGKAHKKAPATSAASTS